MRNTLILISILTAGSQLAAFCKLWFTARIFGLSTELDAYNLVLTLPTLVSGVISGVLQTGLFPVRANFNLNASPTGIASFERSILIGVLAIGSAVLVLLMLSIPVAPRILAGSASESTRQSAAVAFPWLLILAPLNILGDCAGYLLAMRNRFAIAAAAPIANGVFGAALFAVWPAGGFTNLIIGTIIGMMIQVAICVIGLHVSGLKIFGELMPRKEIFICWREILKLGIKILPAVVVANILSALPPLWLSRFGEGAISAFGYAYRLHMSAVQLIIMAGTTVILAEFSEMVARNNNAAIRSIVFKASAVAVMVGGLAFIIVFLCGAQVLSLLFGGRFDLNVAIRVTEHWSWLTFGMPFIIFSNVLAKLWQAQRRPLMMSILGMVNLVVLLLSFPFLQAWVAEFSVAAALSLGTIIMALLGFMATWKSIRSDDQGVHNPNNGF